MNDFHPEIAKVMNVKYEHNQDFNFVESDNRHYYTSEDYFLILNLASTRSGTTRDEVSYTLGLVGVERLNHLTEKGLLIEDKNGRFFSSNQNYKLSFSDTKKRIAMNMKYYRVEEAGSIHNWLSNQTESLNAEGLRALKKLNQKQFIERNDQIYTNPMYKGDIKHYTSCVSSTFLPYTENGGLQ